MLNSILLGTCLEVLRTLPDASVDSIVTDPPYGLGDREPGIDEIIAYLSGDSDLDTGGDFMGRDWHIPSVSVWKECFRVLKPGGHLLSFGGTRTSDLISLGIRAAGFENRDTVASQFACTVLQWVYGQGFPKSRNISKAIDEEAGAKRQVVGTYDPRGRYDGKKRTSAAISENWREIEGRHDERDRMDWSKAPITVPATKEAWAWEGWGTALKPSWEPILVFRKPLEESTVASNVLAHGTGAYNIDATRITSGRRQATAGVRTVRNGKGWGVGQGGSGYRRGTGATFTDQGRWPSNLVVTHADGCKIVGYKKVQAPVINRFDDGMKPFGDGAGHPYSSEHRGDVEGMEELPIYRCAEGCPAKALERQKSDSPHYFGQFQPEEPFLYAAKVNKRERGGWLPGDEDNKHPTMKPLKLMEWLVKLVTPVDGVVLDPYCGTGTTCAAAIASRCNFIGIEKDPESHALARKRLLALKPELETKADEASQREAFELMFDLEQDD